MQTLFNGVFNGKKVLVTGDTGFKGSWLILWLQLLGAKLSGYALNPPSQPNLFTQLNLAQRIRHHHGDVRDLGELRRWLEQVRPEFVFHLAAQPLVRYSYQHPVETFETNVTGTLNVLEAVRGVSSVRVCQIITSDKCYENKSVDLAYDETQALGGHDPYSASKGAAELVVASYRQSFFCQSGSASIASTRAGNVIGGGDWAADRIVPDCMRALRDGKTILVRNPGATRPWQHVLEPLSGYLWLASQQYQKPALFAEAWNFGPELDRDYNVKDVVEELIRCWKSGTWQDASDPNAWHESVYLKLNCDKAKQRLGWSAALTFSEAVEKTVSWYRTWFDSPRTVDAYTLGRQQISDYVDRARQRGIPWSNAEAPLATASPAAEDSHG